MTRENSLKQMAHLAEEATDIALSGQRMAMSVLLAEMRALSAMLPGQGAEAAAAGSAEAEARHRAEEAETEAGFDNMPV